VLPIPRHLIVPDCLCAGRRTQTCDSGTVGHPKQAASTYVVLRCGLIIIITSGQSNYRPLCAKFGWNRYSISDNMHVFQFREFGLKTPIPAPIFLWERGKIGEGVMRCWRPTKSFLLLGVVTSVPLSVKPVKKCDRPPVCAHRQTQTDRRTHAVTETNWIYYLSHDICFSHGTDKVTMTFVTWQITQLHDEIHIN